MADIITLHDHTPSDLFLVRKAKAGDQQATERLLERYERTIGFKAWPFYLPDGDRYDLLQEGRVGLLKAIKDYRPDRNDSFRRFAELCISRQIITTVKTATRGKHQVLNGSMRFIGAISKNDDWSKKQELEEEYLMAPMSDRPEEILMRRERLLQFCLLGFNLTKLEAWSVAMVVAGYSYIEVANELKVDAKAVDNALTRARRKLKPVLRMAA